MLYRIFRISFWGIIFVFVFFWLKKIKITRKKLAVILTLVSCMILCFVSGLFPVENIFVNFKSPEDVFRYTCSGKIEDVVYGDNSCMVYYSTGNSSYSYSFVLKSTNGYKIANYFATKKISHKFERNGSFDVYNVLGTDDYYIIGAVNSGESEIDIFDSNNEKVKIDIKRVKNTSFIYFFLKNFTNEYYLLINGEKISISN